MSTFNDLPDMVVQLIRDVGDIKAALAGMGVVQDQGQPITRKELMERLRITEPTVIRYEKKGLIPSKRIGKHVRYVYSDVLSALDNKKCTKRLG